MTISRWNLCNKVKFSPYSLLSFGPSADSSVQAVSPQVTWSESNHRPGGRLPLLSARPAVTSVAFTWWHHVYTVAHIRFHFTTHYQPWKDERLSWPGWLTCSGWYTNSSVQPLAAGWAQDKGSSPARDRRFTTEPRNQPLFSVQTLKRIPGSDWPNPEMICPVFFYPLIGSWRFFIPWHNMLLNRCTISDKWFILRNLNLQI